MDEKRYPGMNALSTPLKAKICHLSINFKCQWGNFGNKINIIIK